MRPRLARAGAYLALRLRPASLQVLRHNLAVASGSPVDEALVRAAVESYLRTFLEAFSLPGWRPDAIVARVTTTGEHHLRDAFAASGAVVALPHSGNWDLAGAWACLTGMPVTTVAERLASAEFADFLRFREGLGMEVIAHDDPAAISRLSTAAAARRLVCLVADRNLGGAGLPVRWGRSGVSVRMPAGPAVVARRSGAALVPAVCRFNGDGMHISFGPAIQARPGRSGLTEMTQQVADFFAAQIALRPQDWHMFQPFFAPAVER
jgi:KDO2-lipid IV(A) lauroyltransferase